MASLPDLHYYWGGRGSGGVVWNGGWNGIGEGVRTVS